MLSYVIRLLKKCDTRFFRKETKQNPRFLHSVDGKDTGLSLNLSPTKLQTDSTGLTLESVIHIGCSSLPFTL